MTAPNTTGETHPPTESDLVRELRCLSPEKLELLELLLEREGVDLWRLPIPPGSVDESSHPASSAQRRVWFDEQLDPGTPRFNLLQTVRLRGRLDLAALSRVMLRIVDRHATLRTTFRSEGGDPIAVIHAGARPPFGLIDLRRIPEPRRKPAAEGLLRAEALVPFDLDVDLPIRVTCVRLDFDTHLLQVTLHHIASDAWSTGILVRELGALYRAEVTSTPAQLSELRARYADFAWWQKSWLQSRSARDQLAYWRRRLGGVVAGIELGRRVGSGRDLPWRGRRLDFRVPPELTDALKELGRREEASLFMILLAVLSVLLHRYTGRDEVVLGTDIANRNRPEIEDLIGYFVNQLVLRVDLSGNPPFRELLRRIRSETLDAYTNQDLPFDRVVEAVSPRREAGRQPLFEWKIIHQNIPWTALSELPGLDIEPVELRAPITRVEMALFTHEHAGALHGAWVYALERFDEEFVERLSGQYATLLGAVAREPDTLLSALEHRSADERRRQEEQRMRRAAGKLQKFRSIKVNPVAAGDGELVEFAPWERGTEILAVGRPTVDDVDLPGWAATHADLIRERLRRHGAILFRGFDVASPPAFESFAGSVCDHLFNENGEHPRHSVTGNVYTPVFYPPEKTLLWHNENSFNLQWPSKILFCCATPAQAGGETPVVDSRRVYEQVDPEIREKFSRLGVMYVRNYGDGLGLHWRDVFQASERAEAEAKARAEGLEIEWKEGDRLRTRCRRPAVVQHPATGEMSWFNQAQHWHPVCLDDETREALESTFAPDDLPRNCLYGDGTPIENEVMESILDVYRGLEVVFPWQRGDVMVLDNVLAAHGRNAFEGPRKILVAMGDMLSFEGIAAS